MKLSKRHHDKQGPSFMLLSGEYLSASEAKPKPPFAQRQVTLSFQEYIQLEAEKNYWHAQFQHAQAKLKELTRSLSVFLLFLI
jgi:hypothetical protein